jgi:hypothetical protein
MLGQTSPLGASTDYIWRHLSLPEPIELCLSESIESLSESIEFLSESVSAHGALPTNCVCLSAHRVLPSKFVALSLAFYRVLMLTNSRYQHELSPDWSRDPGGEGKGKAGSDVERQSVGAKEEPYDDGG